MADKYPNKLSFPDALRKTFERIAALLGLDDWRSAIAFSSGVALEYAEEYVKGKTCAVFLKPEFAELVQNNPEFFEALCEDGVVEWLTPLVLAKSATPTP